MQTLIKKVQLNGKTANILIKENKIASINKEKSKTDRIIDGKGKAIIPGFINCHSHSPMSLLKGYADDFSLHKWLNKYIWPVESKMTKKDVFIGSKFAILEMIKAGTTCFADMYFHPEQTAKAAKQLGIRAFISQPFISTPNLNEKKMFSPIKKLKKFGETIKPALGPHAIYTVEKELLIKIAEKSEKENMPIHFHLSETEKEVSDCVKKYKKRPVEFLESIGFLSERTVNAHSVWLNKKEISILAKRKASVVNCPVSNMKLAVGKAMPFTELKKAGVNVSLGTDGSASNNNLSMLEEMKFASLLQKHDFADPERMPAIKAFEAATLGGAKAFSLNTGRIAEGMLADFSLVNLSNISVSPGHSLVSDLVYSANDSCIDTVFCNGKILMEKGRVKGEEKIIIEAKKQALDWVSR